jgi:hypothetical protein
MSSFRIGLALAVALVLAAFVFGRPHHPHFWWDDLPAVWALLGYAGAWVLVVAAKALAKHWLERDEDYYDDR